MTQDENTEWRPWIDHDGKGMPDAVVGRRVHVIGETAKTHERLERVGFIFPSEIGWDGYKAWDWSFFGKPSSENLCLYSRVIRYRIRRDPSVQKMVDAAASLDVTSPQVVPA